MGSMVVVFMVYTCFLCVVLFASATSVNGRLLKAGLFGSAQASSSLDRASSQEERLPGWKGETYDHQKSNALFGLGEPGRQSKARDAVGRKGFGGEGFTKWREAGSKPKSDTESWIETISWEPRAFLYHNFMTPEECDHLIDLAKPTMERSTVVDASTGQPIADNIRTSSGTFLHRGEDDIVKSIETRIAAFTHIPPENGEDIQVLHYDKGQKYGAHYDYFDGYVGKKIGNNGGQRKATVLMYLDSVTHGGETVFPDSTWATDGLREQQAVETKNGMWSPCGSKGVAAKAKKGDALLFFSLHADNEPDRHSLHSGCPPLMENESKWTATKWIHVSEFEVAAFMARAPPGVCADLNEACSDWALHGECEKNPSYMKGSGHGRSDGQCRLSCNVCDPTERRCANIQTCVGGALVPNTDTAK